jgi:hypothetical protein
LPNIEILIAFHLALNISGRFMFQLMSSPPDFDDDDSMHSEAWTDASDNEETEILEVTQPTEPL